MKSVVCNRLLVRSIARALRELVIEHQDDWRPNDGRDGIFVSSKGGFAFGLAGMTCRLWRDVISETWSADALNLAAAALWRIRSNLELNSGAGHDGPSKDVSKFSTMEWYGEDTDEPAPSWRRASPILIIGVKTTNAELREALLTGRRFFRVGELREDDNRGTYVYAPHYSSRLDQPSPTRDGMNGWLDGWTECSEMKEVPSPERSGEWWQVFPDRCAEISHELAASGELWVPELFLSREMEEASGYATGAVAPDYGSYDVIIGCKVGEVHWSVCEDSFGLLNVRLPCAAT
jgi:hypothetical protein